MAKKRKIGKVVSNSMLNTAVVEVENHKRHPLYHKLIKKSHKIMAHVNGDKPDIGSTVVIEETRPISKHKSWRVVEAVK